jgi:hypothetical protein
MKLLRAAFLPVLLLFLLGSCAHELSYSPIGDASAGLGTARVTEAYRETRHDGDKLSPQIESVIVLSEALPEGLKLSDGLLSVQDGYSHKVLGRFTLSFNGVTAVSDEEALREVKRVGHSADGDLVVCSFQRLSPPNPGILEAAGYVVKLDPAVATRMQHKTAR